MARYSHSKISTFEQCPYQYKLKYIDWLKPDFPTTIEGFMGNLVHQTLEKLYKTIETLFKLSKEETIRFYNNLWDNEYNDDILIVKEYMTPDDYRKKGEKFLLDYYDKHTPFDKLKIIGLETRDMMTLPDGNEWHVRIDLFAKDSEGNYYIIDHKTSSQMKEQWEIENDKQLAMYSIWARNNFPEANSIKLVWNMLAHNQQVIAEPTEEKLHKLQEEVMIKIARIENATEFPACISQLCNYCGYQNICPYFQKVKGNR
ncbi:MAG: PD-(D/E)XK nuclease family protein [archaeon]|nr:PD-(D/E)XK nuclease family protein [archaeon]MCR4323587.1 PD-(D/E)XK nuclease family protein [Nanoarchaeota archaeon]